MPRLEPGEITAILNDQEGRIVFQIHTERGPVYGHICAPYDGDRGSMRWEPNPDLTKRLRDRPEMTPQAA